MSLLVNELQWTGPTGYNNTSPTLSLFEPNFGNKVGHFAVNLQGQVHKYSNLI